MFVHKVIDDDECDDFQGELFNFEQILRMSPINRLPKIFLKKTYVKQINEFLMAMRYIWWHFRFLFGQTNILSVRQFF